MFSFHQGLIKFFYIGIMKAIKLQGTGTELFSQRVSPEVSSPQQSFTSKFGMDWRVSFAPRAPAYSLCYKVIL